MYGQYNPYMGATPQMQQRLNYLQQQQQQMYQPTMQQPMTMTLKGRIVTSMDEAKAAQIDLDGMNMLYSDYSEIYGSDINMYIRVAKAYMRDPDAPEGKVFDLWLAQMEA